MNCFSVAFLVLLLKVSLRAAVSSAEGGDCNQVNGKWCCKSCPPGTLLSTGGCQKNKNDVCIPCTKGSYSSFQNTQSRCHLCKICSGVFTYKTMCTDKSDAICECRPGYRCIGNDCTQCKKSCSPGTELSGSDCIPCKKGTFSNKADTACIPWTNCSAKGSVVQYPGNSTQDVTCTPQPTTVPMPPDGKIMEIIILVAAAMFLLTSIIMCGMFFITWQKKKKLSKELKKAPVLQNLVTPMEEDQCSCRYPEEEQGDVTGSQEPITKLVV